MKMMKINHNLLLQSKKKKRKKQLLSHLMRTSRTKWISEKKKKKEEKQMMIKIKIKIHIRNKNRNNKLKIMKYITLISKIQKRKKFKSEDRVSLKNSHQ